MQSYNVPQIGRILFSSVLVFSFYCETLGADASNTPQPSQSIGGPVLLKAKDIELPAEANQPVTPEKTTAKPGKTPQGTTIQAKNRPSAAKEPIALKSAGEERALGAPQELPPAKDADRPSPLRIDVSPPALKSKPQTESKVLTFKPEADSSGMAERLRATKAMPEKSDPDANAEATHASPAKEGPSNAEDDAGQISPKQDQNSTEEEIQPIAPDDAPGAVASDRNTSASPEKSGSKSATDGDMVQPVPDFDESGPAPLEAASFNGVTPGQSTLAEVEKAWGPPKEMYKQNELMTQLFSIEPFDRIEVGYEKNKVVSIIVRFQKPFSAGRIAQQLDMATIKPVLILNEMGEILGQSYPERGVLFAFAPSEVKGKPSFKVTHIMLEPIGAEPFILRAETELDSRYDRSFQDLQIALELEPENARANWLSSRVFAAMEQFDKAEAASAVAVNLDPKNIRYCITHAQILGQMGRIQDALGEAQKAIDLSGEQPHLRARALCLKGDLTASGPKPDYRKAIGYHSQALRTADSVAGDEHPAVRKTAKEALVDAHLGSAHDIAWGDWKDKEKAVTVWLKRAVVIAEDLMKSEDGSAEQLFRVHTRALSACVGIRTGTDPKPWLEEALRTGNDLIADTRDPIRKAQYQWDLGMAFYDAVQIYQIRSNHALALQYGEMAVEYLEQGYASKQSPTTAYLLGRLYFRLGAIHAIRDQDHSAAVTWFEKAVPLLDQPIPPEALADLGRFGETFVSMGVSYWETGDRNRAIELTKKGVKVMEDAVNQGTLDRSALAIPYSNLSAMQRQVGAKEEAAKYSDMAARIKNTKTR